MRGERRDDRWMLREGQGRRERRERRETDIYIHVLPRIPYPATIARTPAATAASSFSFGFGAGGSSGAFGGPAMIVATGAGGGAGGAHKKPKDGREQKRAGEKEGMGEGAAQEEEKGAPERGSGMGFFRGGGEAEVAAKFFETRRDTIRNIKRQKTLGTCFISPGSMLDASVRSLASRLDPSISPLCLILQHDESPLCSERHALARQRVTGQRGWGLGKGLVEHEAPGRWEPASRTAACASSPGSRPHPCTRSPRGCSRTSVRGPVCRGRRVPVLEPEPSSFSGALCCCLHGLQTWSETWPANVAK